MWHRITHQQSRSSRKFERQKIRRTIESLSRIRKWLSTPISQETNINFLSTRSYVCLLRINASKTEEECKNYTQISVVRSRSRKKINNVSFRLELSEPMEAWKIRYAFHCSLFRQFTPDQYGRYDQPLPPITSKTEKKSMRSRPYWVPRKCEVCNTFL